SWDTTALIWDLKELQQDKLKTKKLVAKELDDIWRDFAGQDGLRVHQGVWALAQSADQAVPFLEKRLSELRRPDMKSAARWVEDLSSPDFKSRNAATRGLEMLGHWAASRLRLRHFDETDFETGKRLGILLAKLERTDPPLEILQLKRVL